MKLGLFTAAFPKLSLEDVAVWAAQNGFQMLEIACWPMGKAERRYSGVTHIDVNELTPEKAARARDMLECHGLGISSLGYYPNPLHAEAEQRQVVIDHLKRVIEGAALLNVPVVGTFVGRDKNRTIEAEPGEPMPRFGHPSCASRPTTGSRSASRTAR